jgi:hypothetical protein
MWRCWRNEWIWLAALLHGIDLLLTAAAGPRYEGNPIAFHLWMQWGFESIILLKCILLLLHWPVRWAWAQWPKVGAVVWGIFIMGECVGMAVICMWNITILILFS